VTLSESPLQVSCHGATSGGLLRTKLDRSAKRRDQVGDVRSGRFSARSARTRIFRHSRGWPDTRTHGFKINLARKWQLAKYRSVCVNHLTSPPLVAIARAKCLINCAFSRVRLSRSHRCTCSTRTTYPLGPSHSRSPAVTLSVLSCHWRGEPRLRDLNAVLRYLYCYRSRSDNRLESVAYAHTAADLHVRPVSSTALVRDRGRREQLINTTWRAGSNEIDSRKRPATTARRAPQHGRCLPRKSNAMIHFADSTCAATVTFSSK
jgi:hypothetical protein